MLVTKKIMLFSIVLLLSLPKMASAVPYSYNCWGNVSGTNGGLGNWVFSSSIGSAASEQMASSYLCQACEAHPVGCDLDSARCMWSTGSSYGYFAFTGDCY